MQIIVLDGYTLNPGDLSWAGLEALGNLTVYDRAPADLVAERIGNAEIVFTNKTPLTAATFSKCPSVRYVGVLATGYNIVDTAAAKAAGVKVTNIPTYGTASVAQLVFALLLEVCHHVGLHAASVKAGEWSACPDFCYWKAPLIELSGKTLGIVGAGRIGRSVAAIASALGMHVLAYDVYADKSLETESFQFADLDELYAQSDVITLHCPLTAESTGMMNAAAIAKMKNDVIIINTSRGPLVNESDMAAALKSGKVYTFCADVVSTEPILPDNPLLDAPNCLLTPHIAWAPFEARRRLMDIAVENLRAYLAGKPVNVVNA